MDSPELRVLCSDPVTNTITVVVLSLSHTHLSVMLFAISMF